MITSPGFRSMFSFILPLLTSDFELDLDLVFLPASSLRTILRTIARGELGQTSHCENGIQHRACPRGRARDCGLVTCPITFTWLKALTGFVTIMFTCGVRTYSASTFSISRASCEGVLPTATMSSTSGVEILPSGRTGTVTDSSGLRQTNTCKVSPGPMMYSGVDDGSGGTGAAAGGCCAAAGGALWTFWPCVDACSAANAP